MLPPSPPLGARLLYPERAKNQSINHDNPFLSNYGYSVIRMEIYKNFTSEAARRLITLTRRQIYGETKKYMPSHSDIRTFESLWRYARYVNRT